MKVIYLKYHDAIEQEILKSFKERKGTIIVINGEEMVLPLIVNTTEKKFPLLHAVFARHFREFKELQYENPSSTAIHGIQYRTNRLLYTAITGGLDILVIYNADDDISLLTSSLRVAMKNHIKQETLNNVTG
jgi:hypothetical protein